MFFSQLFYNNIQPVVEMIQLKFLPPTWAYITHVLYIPIIITIMQLDTGCNHGDNLSGCMELEPKMALSCFLFYVYSFFAYAEASASGPVNTL